tara:strand:- start:233 stop:448 length:216 start_codon:yes stop_codon:yes gene_type:complete
VIKNVIIAILVAALIWFGFAIVRIENQRYALELEMCGKWSPENLIDRSECLEKVETRTGPIAHLLYGLRLL